MKLDKLTKEQQKAIIALTEWFINNCWKKATLGQKLDFILMLTKPKKEVEK